MDTDVAHRRTTAFTLIELLLVVGLLVMIAGLVWPNLSGREGRARLEYVVSEVTSRLGLARGGAMSTGRRYRCVFDEDGSTMWLEYEAHPVSEPGRFDRVAGQWAKLDLAGNGVRCEMVDLVGYDRLLKEQEREALDEELHSEFRDPIEFYPDGRCTAALIVLSGDLSQDEEKIELRLDGLTGEVGIRKRCREEQ